MHRKVSIILISIMGLAVSACNAPATALPTTTSPARATSSVPATPLPATENPTATSFPSIQILYPSGPEHASGLGGDISLFETEGNQTSPVILGEDSMSPCWILSPDGAKMLYLPAYHFSPLNDFVNLIDFWTREIQRTPWKSADGCPIWHPSSGSFLGSNYETNQTEVYRLGEGVPLATIGETGLPAFSPDGKNLAILIGPDIHLYNMFLDSAGQVTGVSQEYTSLILPLDHTQLMDFRWSLDGRKLAVLSQRIGNASNEPNPTELYVLVLADETLVKVADSRELQPGIGMEISPGFAWSPDGSKIAFSAYTATEAAGMAYYLTLPQVFVTGADGNGLVEITTDPGEVGEAVGWSPDGNQLIFLAGSEVESPEDVPVYFLDHLTMSNSYGSDKIVLPIPDFFVLPGPVIHAPFTLLPPNLELDSLFKPPIRLNCASGWTQLESSSEAVVAPGAPNRVRSEPKKGDNIIAQIPTGTVVKLFDDPVCADGFVFWKVQGDSIPGGDGWTAEGDGIEYYLQPSKP